MERKGEREREGEKGKEGGTVTRKEGGREGGGEGGEVWRDRERETDGQTLKNHLPNFQMGSAHANVYGAIDRAIGRANGVVLRCEKIREGGEVGRDRERVTDGQRQALATPICAPGFEHSTSTCAGSGADCLYPPLLSHVLTLMHASVTLCTIFSFAN